jgi:hypothetical protein
VSRLLVLAICAVLVAACGSSAPPHSKYFIVTFTEGTLEPSAEGQAALDKIVSDAPGSSRVVIDGPLSGAAVDQQADELVRQRVATVEQALTKAGIPGGAVEQRLRDVGEKEFLGRKDTVIVQIIYGLKAESRD